MAYTNWNIVDVHGIITVTADRKGDVNPALHIVMNKETGAVMINGSPNLVALQSNGQAHSCRIDLFECLFAADPNSIQVDPQEAKTWP